MLKKHDKKYTKKQSNLGAIFIESALHGLVMLEQPNVTPHLVLSKRVQKRSKEFMLLMIWLDLESGLPKEFMKNKFNVNSAV